VESRPRPTGRAGAVPRAAPPRRGRRRLLAPGRRRGRSRPARALVLALLVPCGTSSCAPPEETTVVGVAASLTDLASDLAAEWERRSGRPVRVHVAASSTLARQIGEGAPVDLFLSADPRWAEAVDALERRPWLANRLVVVVPADGARLHGEPEPTPPDPTLADRPREDARAVLSRASTLALGGRGVPVGDYAEAALASLDVPVPVRVVRGAHARDVLAKVAEGAADAAIVYATDAALEPRVRVAGVLPDGSHPPVRYVAALLSERSRPLLEALGEPWAAALARRHGFEVLP